MGRFSAGDAAFTGFRVLRTRPGAALIWAVAHLLVQIVFAVLLAATVGPYIMQMQALLPGTKLSPNQARALLGHIGPLYPIFGVFSLIFYPVLIGAMNRVVLRPQEDRFGYLRLGRDELRLLGVLVLFALLGIGAEIVILLGATLVGVLTALIARGAAVAVGVVTGLVLLCGWIFVLVRLSLAFSHSFATRRVSLFGSWSLTMGQFWPMFGTYVLTIVFTLVLYIVAYLVLAVVVMLVGGGLGGLSSLFHPNMTMAAFLTPVGLVHLVFAAVLLTVVWPLLLTPQAFIYSALAGGAGAAVTPGARSNTPWA